MKRGLLLSQKKRAWEKNSFFLVFFLLNAPLSPNAISTVAPLEASTLQTPTNPLNSGQLFFSPNFLHSFLFSFLFFFHSSNENIHHFSGSFCEISMIFRQKIIILSQFVHFCQNFFSTRNFLEISGKFTDIDGNFGEIYRH